MSAIYDNSAEGNVYGLQCDGFQKWKTDYNKRLMQIQDERRAKVEADKQRMEALFKEQIGLISSQFLSKPAANDKYTQKPFSASNATSVPTTSRPAPPPIELNEVSSKKADSVPAASTTNPARNQGAPTFEEIVKRQMEKLELSNEKVSDVPKNVGNKPKQPFLRKGEGIKRYQLGPHRKKTQPTSAKSSQKSLPLEPVQKQTSSSERPVQVHFHLPSERTSSQPSDITVKAAEATEGFRSIQQSVPTKPKTLATKDPELVGFEILEGAAQNNSFCSNSSIVHDILDRKSKQTKTVNFQNESDDILAVEFPSPPKQLETSGYTCVDSGQLQDYISDLQSRKKQLEQQLLSFEVSSLTSEDTAIVQNQRGYEPDIVSCTSGSSVIASDVNASVVALCGPNKYILDTNANCNIGRTSAQAPIPTFDSSDAEEASSPRTQLRQKSLELEKEIAHFKKNNALLTKLQQEKKQELSSLEKEREAIRMAKDQELQKMEKEISAKQSQLKREIQSYNKYQKLRKELPNKRERDEITTLKQQVSTLQEELKKQSMKSNTDSKRLKKLLETAESERNTLKGANDRLETEKMKLLESLRDKEKSIQEFKTQLDIRDSKLNKLESQTSFKSTNATMDRIHNNESSTSLLGFSQSTLRPPQVQFNLSPSIHCYSENDGTDSSFEEIKLPNRTEKIYPTGSKEIVYTSGTREFISADGRYRKFIYYNGDTKEVFPDKRTVYKFADGTVETNFTDGRQVFEHSSGQVETFYPNGKSQTILLDGTTITLYSDGSHDIHKADGISVQFLTDGTEVVKYPGGDTEWRTSEYLKRYFADGSTRTIYASGRSETFYADGRVIVKNKAGEVIVDKDQSEFV